MTTTHTRLLEIAEGARLTKADRATLLRAASELDRLSAAVHQLDLTTREPAGWMGNIGCIGPVPMAMPTIKKVGDRLRRVRRARAEALTSCNP